MKALLLYLRFCTLVFVRTSTHLEDRTKEPIDVPVKGAGYLILATSVFVSVGWQGGAVFDPDTWMDTSIRAAVNAPVAVILSCLIMLVAAKGGGFRRDLAGFLWVPATKAVLFPATAVLGMVLLPRLMASTEATTQDSDSVSRVVIALVETIVVLLVVTAYLCFLAAVVWHAPRGLFGSRDAHPHLRPLVIVVFTAMTLLEPALGFGGPSVVSEPAGAAGRRAGIVLAVVGPGVTLALAAYEFWWFSRRRGVGFRHAYWGNELLGPEYRRDGLF